MTSTVCCPRCGSVEIVSRNYGKKIGSIFGALTGGIGSFAATREGVRKDVPAVLEPDDSGMGATGFAGVVVTTLLGAVAGCVTGAGVGSTLDDAVLDNLSCEECGNTFSKTPALRAAAS